VCPRHAHLCTVKLRAAVGGFAVSFGAVSVLEAALIAVRAPIGAHTLATFAAVAGLFFLVGGFTGAVAWMLLRLTLGEIDARLQTAGRLWLRWWPRDDRRPTAALLAAAVGLLAWMASSWFAIRWLVDHKNGAGLIATASLGSVAALALAAALVAAVAWRVLLRLPLPPLRRVVWALGAMALAGGVAGAWLGWEKLVLVRGVGVVLYALGVVTGPLAVRRFGARRAWLLPAVGVALALLGARSMRARGDLASEATLAREVFTRLARASDFDRDGEPWLPSGRDCAPFDPAIHPYAPGVAGNGVDEDCDGRDDEVPAPALASPPVAPVEEAPSFLLITIDSVRADRLGLYGYDGPTSPALDAWAKRSVVFDRAWSADSGTAPSLWSLMVGKTPFQVDLDMHSKFPPRYASSERTLATHLSAAGYRTEALLCGRVLGSAHWNLGAGFDRYNELCGRKRKARQASVVGRNARSRLKRLSAGTSPFFLWVHFYDPHTPYHDHPDLELLTPYDEEIRHVDGHLRRLLQLAEGVARERRLWVAITADHGENFGEHGRAPHARNLYRQVTRVPLLMRGPGSRARRVQAPVCANDLFPTFLAAAGLTAPTSMRSLLPVLRGGEPDLGRLLFQENSFARPLRHTRAVVSATHHLIMDLTTDRVELYDLEADWDERHDLAGTGLAVEGRLLEALGEHLRTTRLPPELAR